MSDLPEDLVEEILCRVPATSLKTLRYTCKRWNSLCNKRRFIRKHSDKAPKQLLILMLKDSKVCSMSVNLQSRAPSVKVTVEVNLLDPRSNFDQFKISKISHCDGLLLFTDEDYNRLVVWNPCTGQTRWIPPKERSNSYALGSYQDNKSGNNSYKVLCYYYGYNSDTDSTVNQFQIYEINSNLWRTLDVTFDYFLEFNDWGVSLKGKTYWFASDEKEEELQTYIFLLCFDYTTERFERLLLPSECLDYGNAYLSVVREEKLSVLLEHEDSSRTEIWVTNKIDETKPVLWNKILTMEPKLAFSSEISFLVDEEKKFLVYCDIDSDDESNREQMVYIVGEDNIVKPVKCGTTTSHSDPFLFNYVPSLTQIQQGRSKTKKEKEDLNLSASKRGCEGISTSSTRFWSSTF